MFDLVIALAVGAVGFFVVYTLFISVSVSDNAPVIKAPRKTAKPAAADASSGAGKTPSPEGAAKKTKNAAAAKKEKVRAQKKREEDAIIEAELRLATKGMHADVRKAEAATLDEVRERRKAKAAQRSQAAAGSGDGPSAAAAARQAEADEEAGFQVVQVVRDPPRTKSGSPTAAAAAGGKPKLTRQQELDRKLGAFFRNNNKKGGGGFSGRRGDDEEVQASRAIVKKGFESVKGSVWRQHAAGAAAAEAGDAAVPGSGSPVSGDAADGGSD